VPTQKKVEVPVMLGELKDSQIESVLRSEVVGRIGCLSDGHVYVVPVTYVYDGECVYGHSADGDKLRAMRAHPDVCFEVEHVDNLANWQSVIAWGTFEELSGTDAEAGMRLLVDRLLPLLSSSTSPPDHDAGSAGGGHASVYRIRLGRRTGRFEKR
jgi:nitroimidazol reductase NimA-like FMN-containing flavoprotein (pyridoxamine 5'-phosphate oxidase superfamily)